MSFELSAGATRYRTAVRQVIAEHLSAEMIRAQHASGTFNSPELNQALARAGLLERAAPGFGGSDPVELWILFNELEKAGAPYDALAMALMVAGVVSHAGTEAQRARIIPPILEGRALVSLGYSEPDHGSDLAGITTRAVRDGDDWVIDGAKMWTTMAHVADWVLLLTRTDPDVSPRRGLTVFIVPLDAPGITIDPVVTMATERTNSLFLDGVRVGNDAVLGDVDDGWSVLGIALAFERGVMGGTATAVPLLRRFREWADATGAISSPTTRERMARIAIDNQVAELLTRRAAELAASGALPGVEGSIAKLFATDAYQKATGWLQEIAGPEGLLGFGEPGAAADGWIDYDARHAPVTTIYGGTSEINRNNVAQHRLGLPRSRR